MAKSYTADNVRFGRLCRLIIDHGTSVLTDVLQSQLSKAYPSHNLEYILNLASVQTSLSKVNSFNNQQQHLLYPNSRGKNNLGAASKTVTISMLDISLICIMLRNICKLAPPYDKVWDKPKWNDNSLEASVTRIRNFRNTLYGHKTTAEVTNKDFHEYWCKIVKALLTLSPKYSQQDYDMLRAGPIDIDQQHKYERLLELWYQETSASQKALENTKLILDNVTKSTEDTADLLKRFVTLPTADDCERAIEIFVQEIKSHVTLSNKTTVSQVETSLTKLSENLDLKTGEMKDYVQELSQKNLKAFKEHIDYSNNDLKLCFTEKIDELKERKIAGDEGIQLGVCTPEKTCDNKRRHRAERVRPRNLSFKGRESRLVEIREKLTSGLSAVTQRQAIYGLGGVGKTELATEYAHVNKEHYDLIRWIDADDSLIVQSFRDFADDLGIESQDQKITSILRRIFKMLKNVDSWLLVYDNAVDFEHCKTFFPEFENLSEMQHILVTSRNPNWSQTIPLDIFSENEATLYIKQFCGYEANDEDCRHLAETLGYLPLALAQATNYLIQHGRRIPEYLEMFESSKAELLSLASYIETSETTVMTTWLISEAKIREKSPDSTRLLIWCAYLAPDNIPSALFEQKDLLGSKLGADKAYSVLKQYSMVTKSTVMNCIQIHRLVQFVIRKHAEEAVMHDMRTEKEMASLKSTKQQKRLSKQKQHFIIEVIESLVLGLTIACPRSLNSPEKLQTAYVYFPHIKILLQNIKHFITELSDSVEHLMDTASHAMMIANEDRDANVMVHQLLDLQQAKYGRNNIKLGVTYRRLAEVTEDLNYAKKRCDKALDIMKKHYDRNNIEVARTKCTLAAIQSMLGDKSSALKLYKKIIPVFEKCYGKESSNFASLLQNLANVTLDLGDHKKALSLYQDTLRIREDNLGLNHVEVALVLSNISLCLRMQNERKQARDKLQRAYDICKFNKLKSDNPFTLSVIQKIKDMIKEDLAAAPYLIKSGNYPVVIDTCEQLMPFIDNVYGTDPRADIRVKIDMVIRQSLTHLEELLTEQVNHFGPKSLKIAQVLYSMSRCLNLLRKTKEAADSMKRAYEICEYIKSKPDQSMIRIISDMIYPEASVDKTVSNDVMAIAEEAFASDHALIVILKFHTANFLRVSADSQAALSLHEEVLSSCENHFGLNSIEVAELLSNMSQCLIDLDRTTEAKRTLERACNICENNELGHSHPTMIKVTHSKGMMID